MMILWSRRVVRRFMERAKAAEGLLKLSSAARAVASGGPFVERIDLLVKLILHRLGEPNAEIDGTVQIVDQKLNEKIVVGGSGSALGGTSGLSDGATHCVDLRRHSGARLCASPESITTTGNMDSGQPLHGFRNDDLF